MDEKYYFDKLMQAFNGTNYDTSYISFVKNKTNYSVKMIKRPCFRIKCYKNKKLSYISVAPFISDLFNSLVELQEVASDDWKRFYVDPLTDFTPMFEAIKETYERALRDDGFGCCSLYEQCSKAKQCVHNDLMFAAQCIYRQNLKNDRIFYGENRNI